MTSYLLIFFAGAAGSMHCIGMCSGFACAIGGDARGPAASVLRHLAYNFGRLSSYTFLGALAGYAGLLLIGLCGEASAAGNAASTIIAAQRALAALSGLLMIYIGLQFLGLFSTARVLWRWPGIAVVAQALRKQARAPGLSAPLALGVLNGLLPCPLVYAFAAQAAAAGEPLQGLLVMVAFGLGTFPAMLAMGSASLWWRRAGTAPRAQPVHASFLPPAAPLMRSNWRVLGVRAAGGFIVLLGLITLARGVLPMNSHALMGH